MTTYTRGTPIWKVILQTARNLGALWEGSVSSATSVTLVDARIAAMGYNNDHFLNGWIWGNESDGLEPHVITAYAGTTGTFTTSSWSYTADVGDKFYAATNRYYWTLIAQKIREVLWELGDVPVVDTSSLITTTSVLYTLPDAACRDLRQVWIATQATTPYYWKLITKWTQHDDQLILAQSPSAGMPIKLVYVGPHAEIGAVYNTTTLLTNYVSDYVAMDWVAVAAAVRCVQWRMDQPGEDLTALTNLYNMLSAREQALRSRRIKSWPQAIGRYL